MTQACAVERDQSPCPPSDLSLIQRPGGPGDLDRIRDLYQSIGNPERPRSFDHWRLFAGPYGICPSVLAMDGERLAAFYTLMPVRLRLGGETVLAAQSMDTMTHPDYRGRGLFLKLAKACYDLAAAMGVEVVYGFPNENSYPGFIRRLNWDHTGDISRWLRPVRPSRHARVPGTLAPFVDAASALLPRGRTRGIAIELARPAPEALEALLAAWCDAPGLCRIDRSPEWLDWRYAADAEHDYEWISAYRGGELVAAGVWGMRNASWGDSADCRAHLTELMGNDPRGLSAVLATVIEHAAGRSAILLDTVCNVEPAVSALRRVGFVRNRQLPFIVRGLTTRMFDGNIHNHAVWRINGGDLDTL